MTTAEIIKHLQQYPPETIVVQSADPEGNSFSPVFHVEKVDYLPETKYRGDIWGPESSQAQRPKDVVNAVCLWPTS